jgi:hypothetical protein
MTLRQERIPIATAKSRDMKSFVLRSVGTVAVAADLLCRLRI